MNFKLIKKLHDAGFETRIQDQNVVRYRSGVTLKGGWINLMCEHGDLCARKNCEPLEVPTLEELIEFIDGEEALEDIYMDYAEKAINKLQLQKTFEEI